MGRMKKGIEEKKEATKGRTERKEQTLMYKMKHLVKKERDKRKKDSRIV